MYGQLARARVARHRRHLAPGVGQALLAESLGHPIQQEPAEGRRVRLGIDAAVEEDVAQRQGRWSERSAAAGEQRPEYASVEDGQQRQSLEHLLVGLAQAGVQVLGHALELLRQLGDLLLAERQASADGSGEERGDGWGAAQQAREAVARETPHHARGERDQGGGANFVAQQAQIAEDLGRVEHLQANTVGLTLDQPFAQDVQRVGTSALGEDDVACLIGDFLQCCREPRPVHRGQLRERRHRRQLARSPSDRLACAMWNGHSAIIR